MTGIPVAVGELVDVVYLNEVARAYWRKVTQKQVVNTLTETDLLNGELTVAAGALGTNRGLLLCAKGDWVQNTGAAQNAPRFKLKLGAGPTVVLDTNLIGNGFISSGAARYVWSFAILIQNLASGSQWSTMDGSMTLVASSNVGGSFLTGEGRWSIATGDGPAVILGGNASAIDTTAAMPVALTVGLPVASASYDVTLKHALGVWL